MARFPCSWTCEEGVFTEKKSDPLQSSVATLLSTCSTSSREGLLSLSPCCSEVVTKIGMTTKHTTATRASLIMLRVCCTPHSVACSHFTGETSEAGLGGVAEPGFELCKGQTSAASGRAWTGQREGGRGCSLALWKAPRSCRGLWSLRGHVPAPALLAFILAQGPTLHSVFQTGNMNQNNMTYSTVISAVS